MSLALKGTKCTEMIDISQSEMDAILTDIKSGTIDRNKLFSTLSPFPSAGKQAGFKIRADYKTEN